MGCCTYRVRVAYDICGAAGGKNFSMKSEEDLEELMQSLITQIQLKLKNELSLREIFIPNSKAEARCNVFVSSNYASCSKLCIFLQPGQGTWRLENSGWMDWRES